ncbi:hypothetical protein F5Y03DRAFT_367229 [Xylaria venustula]|nr:hypothetical protein F5Y03DRAFT_367229 [Xylaria venustula]
MQFTCTYTFFFTVPFPHSEPIMDLIPPGTNLSGVPAGIPPQGVTPNFVDPPSRAWAARVSVYTSVPAMVVFFVLRLYVRLFVSHSFGADDYTCIIAVIVTVSFCGVLVSQFADDDIWGRHLWDITLETLLFEATFYLKSIVITGALYNVAAVFIKSTFLILYLRLFHTVRQLRIWILGGLVSIVTFHLLVTILVLDFCIPHEGDGGWGSQKYNSRCGINYLRLNTAQGVVSTLTDFYILAIPVTTVLSLQLSKKKRIGVAAIFLTGLLATVFSVVGVVYRFKDVLTSPPDYTWYSLWLLPLGVAELNVGIICTCMPIVFGALGELRQQTISAWSYCKGALGISRETSPDKDLTCDSNGLDIL